MDSTTQPINHGFNNCKALATEYFLGIYGFIGFINDRKIKCYHCFSNPVLFQNLRCEFDGIIVEMDITNSGSINYFDVSIYSNFAYESERLFYGEKSLPITNIIESDVSDNNTANKNKFSSHSNYLNTITLLRMIIGDCDG